MFTSQRKITDYCDESSDNDSDDSESQSDDKVDFALGRREEEVDFGLLTSSGSKNIVMNSDSENDTDQSEVDDMISDIL